MSSLNPMQTSSSQVASPHGQPISIGLASVGDGSVELAALREALESRGAIVHDSGVQGDPFNSVPPPRPDVLLVIARVLDAKLSALIQQIGRQASPYLIVLLESGDIVDRIVALELGADDFLDRHSDPREILARAKCLVRRGVQRSEERPTAANDRTEEAQSWVLNDASRLLRSPSGNVCILSRGDVELIDALVAEPFDVLSREKDSPEANGLRVSISRLRRRFRKVSSEELPIRNIWGLGYSFEAPLKRVSAGAGA